MTEVGADGIPHYASSCVGDSTRVPNKGKMYNEMIKHLAEGDTLDMMRKNMTEKMSKDQWSTRVEERFTKIVAKSDLSKRSYLDMLKELAGLDQTTQNQDEEWDVDKVLNHLIRKPELRLTPMQKKKVFENWDQEFKQKMKSFYDVAKNDPLCYNSSLSSGTTSTMNQL